MSYEAALEAAGAEILCFQSFGSYQGEWYAKVKYLGEIGWINGWYGSCSGCDAFEAEFGYGDGEHCEEHRYNNNPELKCFDCRVARTEYDKRLADFGRTYLTLQTQEWAEKEASRNIEWDDEAKEQLAWVKENAI